MIVAWIASQRSRSSLASTGPPPRSSPRPRRLDPRLAALDLALARRTPLVRDRVPLPFAPLIMASAKVALSHQVSTSAWPGSPHLDRPLPDLLPADEQRPQSPGSRGFALPRLQERYDRYGRRSRSASPRASRTSRCCCSPLTTPTTASPSRLHDAALSTVGGIVATPSPTPTWGTIPTASFRVHLLHAYLTPFPSAAIHAEARTGGCG